MKYKLFDVVETTVSLPSAGILPGALGAIVDAYPDGSFEVEFTNDAGETVALVPLTADQIRLADVQRKAA